MNGPTTQPIQAISKNVYIPIAFVGALIVLGILFGTMQAEIGHLKENDSRFIQRNEFDATLVPMKDDIAEIKDDVKALLKRK